MIARSGALLLVLAADLFAQAGAPTPVMGAPPQASVPRPSAPAPGAMKLTLPEAEQLALKNNPQIGQAQFEARAYEEITREFRAAYFPTVEGDITAVAADSGSRLAAGALNNPIVYNRLGTGVILNELVSDFGRTGNLTQSARLRAQGQQQAVNYTRADILVRTDAAYLGVLRSRATLPVPVMAVDPATIHRPLLIGADA